MKYENLAVVTVAFGDYMVLAFVSGNSKAEVIRRVKANPNLMGKGIVEIDHPDFSKKIKL